MASREAAARIRRIREEAFARYEGKSVSHRSCGVCLAEVFGFPTRPFHAFRRGGLTGEGECGAVKAAQFILGAHLASPDPDGPLTEALRDAMTFFDTRWREKVSLAAGASAICKHLTATFPDFNGEERRRFCTRLVAGVAEALAETLVAFGVPLPEGDASLREAVPVPPPKP